MHEWKNLPEDTSDYIGFVYIIRCLLPENPRYYIGKKQLLKRIKRKPLKNKTRNRISYKDNDVDKYWGSSKELLSDIEKYGLENFEREVIEMCGSKFHMTFAEISWQMKANVLFDERSYNGILNCRISKIPKGYVDVERDINMLKL